MNVEFDSKEDNKLLSVHLSITKIYGMLITFRALGLALSLFMRQ